jgi:hypothetical protein
MLKNKILVSLDEKLPFLQKRLILLSLSRHLTYIIVKRI